MSEDNIPAITPESIVEKWAQERISADAFREKYLETNKASVLAALKEVHATSACIAYSGSGDSGQVDYVYVTGPDGKFIEVKDLPKVKYWRQESKWVDNETGYMRRTTDDPIPLDEALEEFVFDCVDWKRHCGFENNDGGGGSLEVNVETGEFLYNHYDNIVHQEHYSYDL